MDKDLSRPPLPGAGRRYISTAGIAQKGDAYFVALRKPGANLGILWEFPGGKAEEGESPQTALSREYREEFTAEITVGEELFEGAFCSKDKDYLLKVYRIEFLSSPEDFVLTEHSEYRWADRKALEILDFAPSDGMIRDFLLGRGGGN
ncbi:MAG: NUDIX domain-containing protein [Spirochaetales bacterium]|jgi:8-oxo-dGTP diphosphatase|nr:NUDIX domain-containing protein [Spirochaetales bacterium]